MATTREQVLAYLDSCISAIREQAARMRLRHEGNTLNWSLAEVWEREQMRNLALAMDAVTRFGPEEVPE